MKRILTGDRPTGCLHLGHYAGSLRNRVSLQNTEDQYVMIADVQALTDNFESVDKVHNNIFEVVKDYLAVGIDPNKTTIFVQSQVSELFELSTYFLNLVTVSRLERNPTVKSEIQQKGFNNSIPAGFFCYPVSQAADIAAFKATHVPVGDDQLPMIEQTNEIVRRFNRIYNTECFVECNAILGATARLPGIDGKAKASKSLGNAIFLSDDTDAIKRKVFAMYTDPNHLKVSDSGMVDGNVVFAYLDAFHANPEEVLSLKSHYTKGGLGDTAIKQILNTTLQDLINPMREIRRTISNDQVIEIVKLGTLRAKLVAQNTLQETRKAMGMFSF